MADEGKGTTPTGPPSGGENPCGGVSGFLMIFFGILLLVIMFDRGTGDAIARGMNWAFKSNIGLNGTRPLWTLFFAGMITVVFSTVVRHAFANWVENARIQQNMAAFNKELRGAQMANNQAKVEKLQKIQPQVMGMQSKIMWGQLKPMVFTMFVAILIWRWLYLFMDTTAVHPAVTMPWGAMWPLDVRATTCPNPPAWLLIYILLSISVGQILLRALKVLEFKGELKKIAKKREEDMEDRMDEVRASIDAAEELGAPAAPLSRELKGISRVMDKGDHKKAMRMLEILEERVDDLSHAHVKSMKELEVAASVMETARGKGADVSGAQRAMRKAQAMLRKGEPTATIAHAREAKSLAKTSRETHEEISRDLGEVGMLVIDTGDRAYDGVRNKLARAKQNLAKGRYGEARDLGSEARSLYDNIHRQKDDAKKGLDLARKLEKQASAEDILAEAERTLLRSADGLFKKGEFARASEDLRRFNESVGQRMDEYQEYAKELSGAELVLSKAGELVDVSAQTAQLEKARDLAGVGEYGKARDMAVKVQKEADAMHKKAIRKGRR